MCINRGNNNTAKKRTICYFIVIIVSDVNDDCILLKGYIIFVNYVDYNRVITLPWLFFSPLNISSG